MKTNRIKIIESISKFTGIFFNPLIDVKMSNGILNQVFNFVTSHLKSFQTDNQDFVGVIEVLSFLSPLFATTVATLPSRI